MSWLTRIFGARDNAPTRPRKPGVSARVSTDEGGGLLESFRRMSTDLNWLSAKYPFEWLTVIDELYRFDPNCKKHAHSTVYLGNPGHELIITADNEKRAQEALQICNDLAARCFPFAGGADGLMSGLFYQAARFNGMACEWAPDASLKQVERAYLIPLRTIKFRYAPDGSLEIGQIQDGRFVPLNPVQTAYHAIWTEDCNPYPIPPVLAAIRSLITHRKVQGSIEDWFSKIAALGFLTLNFERPDALPGESDEAYRTRSAAILTDLATVVKDNLTSGIALGFDDMTSTFNNTSAGAAGAKQIAQMIDEDLFAGLGRDPVLFGRSFSRTETWSKVSFEELTAEIKSIQLGPKRTVEHGYRLNLALQGYGDVGVKVRFKEIRSLDAFRDAEAEQMGSQKIFDAWDRGLISDEQAVKELGFEENAASAGEFIASFNQRENHYQMLPMMTKQQHWNGWDFEKVRNSLTRELPSQDTGGPPALREMGTVASRHLAGRIEYIGTRLENSARDARNAARTYLFKAQQHLSEAAQTGVDAVYEWARDRDVPEEDLFVQHAFERYLEGAEGTLDSATLERLAKEHLGTIWKWARHEDDSVFGQDWDRGSRGAGIGFGIEDETATRYLSRVDRLYVSQYVSGDEITSRKIQNFLREQYMEKNFGRGTTPKELAQFRDQFGDMAEQITEHRGRVIVDTGVSRCQNWGEVLALHDEAFAKFRIAGPWDVRTCDWCYGVQGKEFSVAIEVERIEKIIESGDEEISKFTDFVTSRYSGKAGLEKLNSLDAADIQASGMVSAPIHPLCRHRTIAVVEVAAKNSRRTDGMLIVLAGSWRRAA